MGRGSVKENKNVYQLKREELGLSREKAAEKLKLISQDRLYRIEHDDKMPHPDEVMVMARAYNDPSLCNHFCTHSCPIGREHVVAAEIKELPALVIQAVAALNAMEKHKDRFIEIAADSKVDENERADFQEIRAALENLSASVESLRLWAAQMESEL